ncbi:hypothetical protein AVEN_48129-1 [Araneus ventricosus]|uniref:Uncharacterized protein n=1 Tax=Araneus ventricosus TaxID=182803 RepID=A0A4Y2L9B7_ARAVE|nr:hypothetical protein AVEN_48129-1 [Araneus ventricosus]
MTAAAIARVLRRVLIAHHQATARSLPKEVRTITGGRAQSPTITMPPGKANLAYLSFLIRRPLIRVLAVPSRGRIEKQRKGKKVTYSLIDAL